MKRSIVMAIMLVPVCLKISAGSISSNLIVELSTDKACYVPGQIVEFTASGSIPSNAIIRYRHGLKVVKEEHYSSNTWTWNPPTDDFKGYMVDLYYMDNDKEVVIGTIAVDVSSDWKRFPRYGFVATFDDSKHYHMDVIDREMAYLNRCHINGVQFQDWHNKHHWPWGGKDGVAYDKYNDIANRDVYLDVLKKYIDVQHSYGMKSIFYNLCFGALNDAAADGVREDWYVFKDKHHGEKDYHGLPSNWKSNIYVLDPGNSEWLNYIGDRNEEVYSHLGFDGFQIDQLGYRGDRYDYNGNWVNLPDEYAKFINAMKERHPGKSLIMNAVSGYGAQEILGTRKLDFCYNEVWGNGNGYGGASEDAFANLYEIIKNNDRFSDHTLRTVFAAYMNYDKAGNSNNYPESERVMNTPGVLLADAVMFALGGSHLELGDHMLSREYFPAIPLAMTDELKTAMIRYYDFMTAYQNLLRETSSKSAYSAIAGTTATGVEICAWPPQLDHVVTFAKNVGTTKVVSFLNFKGVNDNLSWRDVDGTRPKPTALYNLPVSVEMPQKVSKVWIASPDNHGGAPQELDFKQEDDKVTFTLPSLEYWTMAVFECEKVEEQLLIVGTATDTDWNTETATRMQGNGDGSVFSASVRLETGNDMDGKTNTFKFISGTDYGTCTHYNAEYDEYNFNDRWGIHTAGIVANTDNDFKNSSKDYQFTVAETGKYDITVDLNSMLVRVEKSADFAAVNNVMADNTGNKSYYSISGMKMEHPIPQKIYIHNGRKAITK